MMKRLNVCLALALIGSLTGVTAQGQAASQDDGRLRTLPGSDSEDLGQAGPRKVTQIGAMLAKADFDRLDAIAEKARTEKTRGAGGAWRLKIFYEQMTTQQDIAVNPEIHQQQLEAWIKAKPESVTARIGLARFYIASGWAARGSATEVEDSAWPIFLGKVAKGKGILDQAAKLTQKDPEWYSAMQSVALAQDWDHGKEKSLFEQAVRFEPDYQYYYESYANYLLPKWEGAEHDSTDFAKKSADTVGGERGDTLYFQIAGIIIRRGNAGYKPEMDWERLKRGHAALESTYGITGGEQNRFAFMAVRFHDAVTAKKEFELIGERWSVSVWRSHGAFEKARVWAGENAGAKTDAVPS
jgi:hypothetical protein